MSQNTLTGLKTDVYHPNDKKRLTNSCVDLAALLVIILAGMYEHSVHLSDKLVFIIIF